MAERKARMRVKQVILPSGGGEEEEDEDEEEGNCVSGWVWS